MTESVSPWVRNVTEADFEREVIEASRERPVVVDFWAPWCGPCLALAPVLEQVINERGGEVLLAKVNTDACPNLAQAFRISGIPSVKAIRNGQIVQEFEGVRPADSIRQFLDSIMPSPLEKEYLRAQSLEKEKPAEAESIYRDLLAKQPDVGEIRVALAGLLVSGNQLAEIEDLLEPVGSEGAVGVEADRVMARLYFARLCLELPEEKALRQKLTENDSARTRYELGCVLARQGDSQAALEMLLAAGEKDAKLASGPVREAMVKVFYLLGSDHPLANEYRSRLSRMLY
jgi:putative thioredoxin